MKKIKSDKSKGKFIVNKTHEEHQIKQDYKSTSSYICIQQQLPAI